MNIVKDFDNRLLKRRELEIVFPSKGNPGFDAVKKKVAEEVKAGEDVVVVKGVWGDFGSNDFKVLAFVYDDAKIKESVEPKPKVKKGTGGSG